MVAASLTDTLSRIGAIGGIIAVIGTGLLILLVAAQNRQIRSMKEWIDAEPERQQETTQRVVAEVQRRIAAARERRAGGAPAAAPVAVPAVPARPVAPAPGTLGATPEAKAIAGGAAAGSAPPPVVPPPGAPKFA